MDYDSTKIDKSLMSAASLINAKFVTQKNQMPRTTQGSKLLFYNVQEQTKLTFEIKAVVSLLRIEVFENNWKEIQGNFL
jgi:hypothetical protein